MTVITVGHVLRARIPLVLMLCAGFVLGGSAPVLADTPSSGGDSTVAQTLGDRELTVILRRVTSVPGPLRVDIVTHTGSPSGELTLELTPTGTSTAASALPAPGAPTARGTAVLGPVPGMYSATMAVDRPGPWELAIGDGKRTTRVPFEVLAQVVSPPERLIYGGFLAAGVLLVVSIVVAVRARRGWLVSLPAGGMLAGLSVAVTAAVLSASLPLPPQPGGQTDPSVDTATNPYALSQPLISDYSRPPVMLAIDGCSLTAGRAEDIGLDLIDGATGAAVDDLVVHDSALIHLLVVGPTGQLWHVHPIRTGPGHYQQHLLLPLSGHYAVAAELVRRGGGVQFIRAPVGLNVAPARTGPPDTRADPVRLGGGPLTGTTVVDGTPVAVTTTTPVAGLPTTVTAMVGGTADLQPWLGMVGHLIVAGPLPPADTDDIGTAVQSAPVWAHAHSMGSLSISDGAMAGMSMSGMSGADAGGGMDAMIGMKPVNGDSAPDETVAAYGPDVPFTFTFPIAGRYRLWIQAERDYTVLTVPVVLDVAAAPGQELRR